ncbi:MAG: radical SAM protein, partial [Candidatus Aenigmarchaeota archaeon]|nr:radical SAM protein [Candidatus Aenigmarchaeota archaeon]
PRTPLWYEIEEKYGIFDHNWAHYDTKHLVWNHPNIRAKEMEKLLEWGFKTVYPPFNFLRSTVKFRRKYTKYDNFFGIARIARYIIHANAINNYKRFISI